MCCDYLFVHHTALIVGLCCVMQKSPLAASHQLDPVAIALEAGLSLVPFASLSDIVPLAGGSFGELHTCKMNGVTPAVLKKNTFNSLDPSSILKDLEFLSSLRHPRIVLMHGA